MANQGKIRVALEDGPDSLRLVESEVYLATGLTPAVELQEIERGGELVMELRLDGTAGSSSADLARMIAAGTRFLDVLSAWIEPVDESYRPPIPCQVVDLLECEIPDLALRAHRDGLPTARWHHASSTRTPHWLLAVPAIDANRKAVVGICRRSGYHYRFSAAEAASLMMAPALA